VARAGGAAAETANLPCPAVRDHVLLKNDIARRVAALAEQAIMNTNSGTVTVWQSGRLAPHLASRSFHLEWGREQWLGAALLMLSAVVLAAYVGVLRRDVERNELDHAAQRSRAVAEAQCEDEQPADQRGRCLALFNGDTPARAAPPVEAPGPVTYEQENAARALTVSLAAAR
jgi:hypothetical protein